MVRWFWVSCVISGVVFFGGCSADHPVPKSVKVSGTVTLEGKPLENGTVTLVNALGFPPDVFPIKDGQFEGLAKMGSVKVQIRAYRESTEKPTTAESTTTPANYLPSRFNNQTTLTAEVTDAGLNPSKFGVQAQ